MSKFQKRYEKVLNKDQIIAILGEKYFDFTFISEDEEELFEYRFTLTAY